MKKIVFIFVALGLLLGIASQIDFEGKSNEGCPFCTESIVELQRFYENELAFGMLTHKPAAPGHVLIIPKRHVERFEDLTKEEISAIGEAIQKTDQAVRKTFLNKDYALVQKNGRSAGQSVPHVHVHYLPAVKFLAIRYLSSHWQKPMSKEELRSVRDSLSAEF
jgi:diadenosine tetraphosphate (Ap4A) HIT family hydrolase